MSKARLPENRKDLRSMQRKFNADINIKEIFHRLYFGLKSFKTQQA